MTRKNSPPRTTKRITEPITDMRPWITALRASHRELAAVVDGLDHAALLDKTCERDMTVAQLLAHIGSGAEISLAVLGAAVRGQPLPSTEVFETIRGRWKRLEPLRQAADWRVADDRYIRRLEGLDDDDFARLRIFMYTRWVDAVGLVCPRLGEHAVHTWDIEVLRDRGARVSATAVSLIIDEIHRLPPWFTREPERHFRAHVVTSDPNRDFVVTAARRVTITPGRPGGAVDARGELPAEAFVRLLFGRLDPDAAPQVAWTSGDLALADLAAVFPGGL